MAEGLPHIHARGVGVSDDRNRAGGLVVVRHSGLGRLLGLGSGGERIALALALRHGFSAFGDGSREPRHSGGLEHIAHLRCFQPDYSRHFSDTLGSAGLGAFLYRIGYRARAARVLRFQLRGVRGACGLAGGKHQGRQTAAVGVQSHRVAHRQ